MDKKKALIIFAIILVLGGCLYIFLNTSPAPNNYINSAVYPPEANQNIIFSGSSIVEEENGQKIWELSAENIEMEPATKNIILKNLKGVYYKSATEKIELAAVKGFIDGQTRNLNLEGSISVVTPDGAKLTCQKIRYDAKAKKFYGSDNVVFAKGDTTITGQSFESDDKFQKVKIYGNAKALKGGK